MIDSHRLTRRAASGLAVAALLGVLAAAGRTAAAGAPQVPATGRVYYQVSSPMMSGTMVTAWVDHGKKSRQDMKLSVNAGGRQASIDTWSLQDGTYVYTYQPGLGNQVMRMRLSKAAQASASVGGVPGLGASGSGKVIGKATVLGHSCEIRSLGAGTGPGHGKVWLWNGMPLRVETGGPGGGMTMVATRVETAPRLSPASFKLPAGYQVKDVQLPAGAATGMKPHPR